MIATLTLTAKIAATKTNSARMLEAAQLLSDTGAFTQVDVNHTGSRFGRMTVTVTVTGEATAFYYELVESLRSDLARAAR